VRNLKGPLGVVNPYLASALILNRISPPFFVVLFAALFSSLAASSQVVINEFSCSNYSLNVAGNNEDFVELFNPTGGPVDIGGWFMSDNIDNPTKFEIPAGTIVPPNGFLTIICSGSAQDGVLYAGGFLNTNFRIHQCKQESVVLADALGNILESYTYGTDVETNQEDHSWARNTDGTPGWKVCTNPTPNATNAGAAGFMFDGYVPKPVLGEAPGYHANALAVAITAESGMEIHYTLDGYRPDDSTLPYVAPIGLFETTVVRAVAIDPTGVLAPSFVETNTYFFGNDAHSIRVVSVSGPGLEDGEWFGDEPMHIEFFHEDGSFWVEAEGDSNEHGNDSNAYPQKGFDYVTRDQMGHDDVVDAELFHLSDRGKFQRLIFKAAANDNYPFSGGAHIRDAYVQTLSGLAELHLDERTNESCILYINGQYWGVYEYREKVDDSDFTNKYYDQGRYDIDFLKTWGGTWEEYGDGDDWYTLVDYITGNDMTVVANYQNAVAELNEMSLIDYFILNSYVVCADWLNWNTAWWRGRNPDGDGRRWRYALWDMDNTFGHGANYTGVPDTGSEADPCNPESLGDVGGQGHIPVLNALLENDEFWATYINRWADLGNTHFSCDNMHAVLDSMIAVIDPEMPRQIDRWGGDYASWQAEVQEVHDFIDERCNETVLSGMEDCYDVEPVTLTLLIDGCGEVELNSVDITPDMVPFSGWYFADVPMSMEAEELCDGAEFLYWEVESGDLTFADDQDILVEFELSGDVTITAHFGEPVPPETVVFNVEPAGVGDISVNGVVIGPYPDALELFDGDHDISASADAWWAFTHWTWENNGILPDAESASATLLVDTGGTVTAHFDYVEHVDLIVDVEPVGSGSVEVVGRTTVTDHWEDSFEVDGPQAFNAKPAADWQFDRWEVIGSVSSSALNAPELGVELPADGAVHVIAHFTELDLRLFVPNAFSPNNDGLNDGFRPLGQAFGATDYRFEVFNRWGEVVFSSTNPEEHWVGQDQRGEGEHFVRDGQYAYSVQVRWTHGNYPETFQGMVMVIR
jgi:gliding motility-associated-like protein